MIRFSLLGSGSQGNALLVVSSRAKILIDSGLSLKRVQERVAGAGESLEGLKAVFVTHEHTDHVSGVGVLARKTEAPVYMTEATRAHLPPSVGRIPYIETFEAGEDVAIDGLVVSSFSVSHDAADPVSFVVRHGDVRLGIACDLGHAPRLVQTRLKGANALVLESNHCPDLLMRGPYPPQLQQRVRSRHGHLSNPDMNALLSGLVHEALEVVVLAHLSQENNTRILARDLAAQALEGHPARLCVARQDQATPLFAIGRGGGSAEAGP